MKTLKLVTHFISPQTLELLTIDHVNTIHDALTSSKLVARELINELEKGNLQVVVMDYLKLATQSLKSHTVSCTTHGTTTVIYRYKPETTELLKSGDDYDDYKEYFYDFVLALVLKELGVNTKLANLVKFTPQGNGEKLIEIIDYNGLEEYLWSVF